MTWKFMILRLCNILLATKFFITMHIHWRGGMTSRAGLKRECLDQMVYELRAYIKLSRPQLAHLRHNSHPLCSYPKSANDLYIFKGQNTHPHLEGSIPSRWLIFSRHQTCPAHSRMCGLRMHKAYTHTERRLAAYTHLGSYAARRLALSLATRIPRGFLTANKKIVNSSRFRGGAIARQKDLWQCRVQLEVEGQREENISPDPAILLPLFHHNHHQINSNWSISTLCDTFACVAAVKVSPLQYWT